MSRNRKPKPKARRASLSGARNVRELADFWSTHDLTDFEGEMHDVEIEVQLESRRHYVAIDPELMRQLMAQARARGLSAQSLANLWIQERLVQQAARA